MRCDIKGQDTHHYEFSDNEDKPFSLSYPINESDVDTLTSIELQYTLMLTANGERKPVMHGYKGTKVAQWVDRSQAIEDVYLDISQPLVQGDYTSGVITADESAPYTVEDTAGYWEHEDIWDLNGNSPVPATPGDEYYRSFRVRIGEGYDKYKFDKNNPPKIKIRGLNRECDNIVVRVASDEKSVWVSLTAHPSELIQNAWGTVVGLRAGSPVGGVSIKPKDSYFDFNITEIQRIENGTVYSTSPSDLIDPAYTYRVNVVGVGKKNMTFRNGPRQYDITFGYYVNTNVRLRMNNDFDTAADYKEVSYDTGRHRIEFYWVCKSATDPDNDTFSSTGQLKDYELTNLGPLYYTYTFFDVLMNDEVSGTRYIWNVKLQQAGGEFTEATNTSHKISLHPDTLAKCYPNLQLGIPSEWKYSSDSDAYTMYFWLNPRHGYEFAPSSATASDGVTLNVQHTEVTRRSITNGSLKALVIDLVAKRKLTDVSGTLKNFRLGIDAGFTEIVSNDSSKYTFQNTVVYDPGYGSSYGVEAGQLCKDDMCYVYFDIKPEFGYYIPENAPVKVILPAGYRANGIFDTAETYSTVYKGDWISYSPINQKYRVSQLLEPNSEGKEYGTDIRIQEPVVGDCPVTLAGYDKPLSLPQNMKVLSMQWLGPDNEPMRKFDKFELGKYYTLDLSIGFEGGEEKGYVFPKNWKEFKVNGKSVNAWMEYEDSTDGHVWHVYHPYKLVDPSAMGTVTGTVESYGDPDETITIQLVNSGNGEPEYITTVTGNSTEYSLTGVEPRSYVMRVEKNKHITEEFIMQVDPGTKDNRKKKSENEMISKE